MEQAIDLSAIDGGELLMAAANAWNDAIIELDARGEQITLLRSQLDGLRRQVAQQTEELRQAGQDAQQQADLIKALAKERSENEALKKQLALANQTNKAQLDELRELRQLNPKKQQARIKEQKAKAEGYQARIAQLEREAIAYRADIAAGKLRERQGIDKIRLLEAERANAGAPAIYHNGDHHLVIWPQLLKLQTEGGEIITQRPLLYMHQSGRGALLTLDPNSMELSMAASPKGGLKPPTELLELAGQWLYKVNQGQGGDLAPEDFTVIDYNQEAA